MNQRAQELQLDLGYLRTGDFFGERSLFLDQPRDANVQAVADCQLLCLPPKLFKRLLAELPAFRERLEQRIDQYDYRRLARVPLDFAEEILPAEVSVQELVSPDRRESLPEDLPLSGADEFTGEGRPPRRRIRRFPHLYQLDEADCGAACLAMICRHYGRAVSIPHIREVVHTSTDGTSLAGITSGAGELGLEAHSVRASKSNLDKLPLPAVVHWEGNHWVVLYAVQDGHVRVSDPARGIRKIHREEFVEKWSGYASLVSYTPRLAQAPEATRSVAWLAPFVRPHLGRIGLAFLLACVGAGLQLVLPILTQVVVDRVLPHHDLNLLYIVSAAIAGVLLVMTGATLLQRYLLSRVAVLFDVATIDFVTGKLLDLPMSYFNTRRTGDIERRLEGVRQVREFLASASAASSSSGVLLEVVKTRLFGLFAGFLSFPSRSLVDLGVRR